MRYYLKSNENMIFLKNKKDILSFNTSAMVLDINFDYTTNRGNKKNKTTRVVYFNNSYYVKFLLSKTNKLISCIEDFFYNVYIDEYNKKYPYRALTNIKVCNIDVVETITLDFDSDGLYIDLKCELNKRDVIGYSNNLLLCESQISYKQNNKLVTKLIYSFDTNANYSNHSDVKSKECIQGFLELDLNRLEDVIRYKGKYATEVKENKKISNVKILDILKISTLSFV